MFSAVLFAALVLAAWPAPAAAPQGLPDPSGPADVLAAVRQAKGKVVIVNFWAAWCAPCRLEIPSLIDLRGDYPEDQLAIIGVSLDKQRPQYEKFKAKAGFNYPVTLAEEGVIDVFRVGSIPKLLVYAQNGTLAHVHEGLASREDLGKIVDILLGKAAK